MSHQRKCTVRIQMARGGILKQFFLQEPNKKILQGANPEMTYITGGKALLTLLLSLVSRVCFICFVIYF